MLILPARNADPYFYHSKLNQRWYFSLLLAPSLANQILFFIRSTLRLSFKNLQRNYQMIGQSDLERLLGIWPKYQSQKNLKKEPNFMYLISAKWMHH